MSDHAGFGELDHLNWVTEDSHPWSKTEYQTAEYDHGTWARIVRDGREVVSPQRNTTEILRQYQSRVSRASMRGGAMSVQYGVDGRTGEKWTVFRVTGDGATEDVATYGSEYAAETVAETLSRFAGKEAPESEADTRRKHFSDGWKAAVEVFAPDVAEARRVSERLSGPIVTYSGERAAEEVSAILSNDFAGKEVPDNG